MSDIRVPYQARREYFARSTRYNMKSLMDQHVLHTANTHVPYAFLTSADTFQHPRSHQIDFRSNIKSFHTGDRQIVYRSLSLHDLDVSKQIYSQSCMICMICTYEARVAGWELYNLHDLLTHVSWVISVLRRSCTTPDNSRR